MEIPSTEESPKASSPPITNSKTPDAEKARGSMYALVAKKTLLIVAAQYARKAHQTLQAILSTTAEADETARKAKIAAARNLVIITKAIADAEKFALKAETTRQRFMSKHFPEMPGNNGVRNAASPKRTFTTMAEGNMAPEEMEPGEMTPDEMTPDEMATKEMAPETSPIKKKKTKRQYTKFCTQVYAKQDDDEGDKVVKIFVGSTNQRGRMVNLPGLCVRQDTASPSTSPRDTTTAQAPKTLNPPKFVKSGDVHIPVLDNQEFPLPKLEQSVHALNEILKTRDSVVVSCKSGVNRSVAVIVGWIMWRHKCSFAEAYTQVQETGKRCAIHKLTRGMMLRHEKDIHAFLETK